MIEDKYEKIEKQSLKKKAIRNIVILIVISKRMNEIIG